MSEKLEKLLSSLDTLLELEAMIRLEDVAEAHVNDVIMPAEARDLRGLNRGERLEAELEREARVAVAEWGEHERIEAERREAAAWLEQEKRFVFNKAYTMAPLYLRTMIARCEPSLSKWARTMQAWGRQHPEHHAVVTVYVYLTLQSQLEWDAAHEEPQATSEDRFRDEQLKDEFEDSMDPFANYRSTYSLTGVVLPSTGRTAIVERERPDLVAA